MSVQGSLNEFYMYYAPLPLSISVANSCQNYSAIAANLMITVACILSQKTI
jgi:hypothetical protein